MAKASEFEGHLERLRSIHGAMMKELSKAIIGQRRVVNEMLAALFCNAHCLLVGVPGLAKTLIVRSLAKTLNLQFRRIQFTPDLMPSDITGTNVIDEDPESRRRDFKFLPGPVFANVVLADEINRTPPKTQAALLESMQERQVSVGNTTYPLPDPFFVIATQNPIEQEGTYPLPEAQLDRFMFNIKVDYPTEAEEKEIFRVTTRTGEPELSPVIGAEEIKSVQSIVDRVVVSDHCVQYVADLVRRTRPQDPNAPEFIKEMVDWGAGPRAGQYLIRGARAFAAMEGRPNISCEDIRHIAVPVLRHRLGINFQAEASGLSADRLVEMLIEKVLEPTPE